MQTPTGSDEDLRLADYSKDAIAEGPLDAAIVEMMRGTALGVPGQLTPRHGHED